MVFFDKLEKFAEKADKFLNDVMTEEKRIYTKEELIDIVIRNFKKECEPTLIARAYELDKKTTSFDWYSSIRQNIETIEIQDINQDQYKIILRGRISGKDAYGMWTNTYTFDVKLNIDRYSEISNKIIIIKKKF